MLRKLNQLVVKIKAVHIRSSEAKCTNSNIVKELEIKLLVTKSCHVMLISNLWTKVGLVNSCMRIIQDTLFEGQGPLVLSTAVLIKFEKYNGLTIKITEGVKVILIA